MGMSSSQVLLVQQILNRNGFVIVQAGPGSPGNETIFFGSLTREAVKRFQCAKQIVCGGEEANTRYGMFGVGSRQGRNHRYGKQKKHITPGDTRFLDSFSIL